MEMDELVLYGELSIDHSEMAGNVDGDLIFGIQGPKGDPGPVGNTGDRGPTGPAGKDGVSPVVTVTPITNGYKITIKDVKGEKTVIVKDGTGIQVLGSYENVEDLRLDHPKGSVGNAYLVGMDLYIWSATEKDWVNAGQIQGPAGRDGVDGLNGLDGISVTHKWEGTVLTITSASGTSSADLKGQDGHIGKDGADGVSATHEWNGTVLTITSASGTSSADLKGRDGNDGVSATHSWNGTTLTVTSASGTSSANLKGADGATPQRGADYWTAADIAEIKSYVDEAILGGAW